MRYVQQFEVLKRGTLWSKSGSLALSLGLALVIAVLALFTLGGKPQPALLRHLFTDVSGTISADTVWDVAGSPYVLTGDVTVAEGVRLTIEPGVTVKGGFYSGLFVRGHLEAVGTGTQGILITSETDTGAYQWEGIRFENGGTGHLRHVTVRYARDYNIDARGVPPAGLRIESSHLMRNRGDHTDYGLYVNNSTVVLSNTHVARVGDGSGDFGVYVTDGSQITITHCSIYNNKGWGLWVSNDSDVWLADSNIHDNGNQPVRLDGDNLHLMSNNVFTGNTPNYIVTRGALVEDVAFTNEHQADGYHLEQNFTVPSGVTLTVDPGVTVYGGFYTALYVRGYLDAVGTATTPITFTSLIDTGPYQWESVRFENGGTGHLRHATVRYARSYGIRAQNVPSTTGLHIESSRILRHRGDHADHGLFVRNSTAVVSDTLIAYTGDGTGDYGIYADEQSRITVTHSTIRNNKGWGVWVSNDADVWLTDNAIYDNGNQPVRLDGDNLHLMNNNVFTGNIPNYIVTRGALVEDVAFSTDHQADGYHLEQNFTVPAGVTLTVEPDVTVYGGFYTALYVRGYLDAVGTVTEPITFTSLIDTGPYQWEGVRFENGGAGHLRHATVRYARAYGVRAQDVPSTTGLHIENSQILRGRGDNQDYGIYLRDSTAVISDSLIANNGNLGHDYGLYVGSGSMVTLTGSTIRNNGGTGLGVSNGDVRLSCSTVSTNGNHGIYLTGFDTDFKALGTSIYDNGADGLHNTTGSAVDATYTWWGAADGPSGEGPGSGDEVDGDVLFDPWLTWEHCPCDVAVTAVDTPDPVSAGETLIYSLIVKNNGPGVASDVVVSDSLPLSVTVAALSSPCIGVGSVVTCTFDGLAPGSSVTGVITAEVDAAMLGVMTSTISVAATEVDYALANNHILESTTVQQQIYLPLVIRE